MNKNEINRIRLTANHHAYCSIEGLIEEARTDLEGESDEVIDAYRTALTELLEKFD